MMPGTTCMLHDDQHTEGLWQSLDDAGNILFLVNPVCFISIEPPPLTEPGYRSGQLWGMTGESVGTTTSFQNMQQSL